MFFLLRPREQLQSIVISLSLSLCMCVSVRISPKPHAIFTKFFVHVAYGHGSVFLQRHCDMLCTSGFVDDIMFFSIMGHIAE